MNDDVMYTTTCAGTFVPTALYLRLSNGDCDVSNVTSVGRACGAGAEVRSLCFGGDYGNI